jgi:LPXTG-site transpeptidase (sortase) family protein
VKLKRINAALFIAIMIVVAYIVVCPFIPALVFWIEDHATSRLPKLNAQVHLPATNVPMGGSDERLVIPAMLLDMRINEGRTLAAANSGPWRRPNTSTPDRGGNTVIIGHRFTYTNPRGVFYYLNKLKQGDEIAVFWHGKRYVYKVSSVKIVPPTDTGVEAPTADTRLTLYTCTPLWLPKNRLVVTAALERP